MNKTDVVIVIPYYTNNLTDFERFSLQKALDVFAGYRIVLAAPEGLAVAPEYAGLPAERFDKKYFAALRGYNQLLLSPAFYERFLSFTYLLIYQLDALVFRDELPYWCSLGYDYYGAPWNKIWRKRYYNFYGLWTRKVGNGGFSLRKTEVFFKMTKRIKPVAKYIRFGEDIFWCTYGHFVNPSLRIIDYKQAIRFAFESQPAELYKINNHRLPFGCHAYTKNDLQFWKQVIFELPC